VHDHGHNEYDYREEEINLLHSDGSMIA